MKNEFCNKVFLTVLDYQAWLIAISGMLVAILCVFIGYLLTLKVNKDKAKSLEAGFYNETNLIKEYFQQWLPTLVNEFINPVQSSLSGFTKIDMSCIDALIVELISMNKILTKEQRSLILSLKSKIRNIEAKDHQRDTASPWNEHKESFIISTPCTARLIYDSVEVIVYLKQFAESKSAFNLAEMDSWESKAQVAFIESGIEYESQLWKRIISINHES